MRKANPERFEARKQHIRAAALACFRRSGFHGASMADICAEAGMSPGNLYRYYDSKEAIIEAICEDDLRQVTARFAAMGGRKNLLEAMLELTAEAMSASSTEEKRSFAFEILAEAARNERVAAIVQRHSAALLAICVRAIANAQEHRQVDPSLDPTLAATLLIAAADGLGVRLAVQPDLDAERCTETFKLLIARFLQPRA